MDPEDLPDMSAFDRARSGQPVRIRAGFRAVESDRPFIVFAPLLDRALGDFVVRSIMAASIRQMFENAHLHVYYRNDRPYKRAIIRLNPWIDRFWEAKGKWTLPVDYFDAAGNRTIVPQDPSWDASGSREPDLFLAPTMLHPFDAGSLPHLARLRVPDGDVDRLHRELTAAGLDTGNWFCVLHYREPSYGYRGREDSRDIDPADAIAVTRYITGTLGGQVVRIGHAEMSPFPRIDGFVDLSRHTDALLLHAYAVSRARFFFEASPSGPMGLAIGFGVPIARCNDVVLGGPADAKSLLLPRQLIGPDGRRVDQALALSKSLITDKAMKEVLRSLGYRFATNSVAELEAAARDICGRTTDCPGWRVQEAVSAPTPAGHISFPLPRLRRFSIVDYQHLAPGAERRSPANASG